MDRFRIACLMKILTSGLLNDELAEMARKELKTKCMIYGTGAKKRGKKEEAEYYLRLGNSTGDS
jgi:hypothetical protein